MMITQPLTARRTRALYYTVSPAQLAALIRTDWQTLAAEPGGGHFLYLKREQRYAEMIARQWEVPVHGAGYVLRLILPEAVMAQYDLETVAYEEHLEYRVPVCELPAINRALVGAIALVSAFHVGHSYSIPGGSKPLANLLGEL